MIPPFSRREFLKAGGAALAATTLASTLRLEGESSAIPPKKRDIKKGIMWACVPGTMSIMDKFKMVRDAGFDGIEIACQQLLPATKTAQREVVVFNILAQLVGAIAIPYFFNAHGRVCAQHVRPVIAAGYYLAVVPEVEAFERCVA